jgi:hypothetical protein
MKPLILAMLVFCTSVFAQENLDRKIKALEEARENALFQWRTEHRKSGKLPDPEYVTFYNQTWSNFALDEIDARKAACGRTNPNCFSADKQEEVKAKVRIVTGLMTAKNNWATEGKSEAEIKTREEAYETCVASKKDCDKLPENDRKVAEEGNRTRGGSTVVVTTDPKPDTKPTDVVVVKPGDEASKKLEDATKVAEDALKKELDDLEAAFTAKNPGWEDKEMSAEVKDFLISQQNARVEKLIEMKKKLCEQFPGTDACLKAEDIAKLRDDSAGTTCFIERKFALKSVAVETHKSEWEALPAPKACKTLLDKDKTPVSNDPKKEVPVVEEGDDEKTPRNYKAETCKWVSDLPRKIVNGPGCGGKSRSRICTGYVVCEQKQGGGKFIRMSSCGPDKCGSSDEDAVKCTKDMSYYSQKPATESKLFMSPKLKKILSGSSEQ